MYSPSLGRFVSADTIVPSPGDPQSLNRYSYGLNNPVKYSDPTGHVPVPEVPPHFGLWNHLNVNVSDWSLLAKGLLQYGACTLVPCTIGADGQVHDDVLAQANASIPGPAIITSGSSQFIKAGVEVADEAEESKLRNTWHS